LNSFLDSGNLEATWDEYRCLSVLVTYVPNVENAIFPSVAYTVAAGVVDNDNSTALTSLASAADYESCKFFSLTRRTQWVFRMMGSEDSGFLNSGTTATAWFKFYATSLTASQNYGQFIVVAIFQFRGRI
jgi:hypothetical protein